VCLAAAVVLCLVLVPGPKPKASARWTQDAPDTHVALPDETPSPPKHDTTKATPPVLDRRRADEMRARILALLAEAGPGRVPDPVPPEPRRAASAGNRFREMPSGGPGNQAKSAQGDYIRSVVRDDFFPLAQQCYAGAMTKHPGLRGTVELDFRIVGDTKVGGVVDEASLGDAGDLHDDDFTECMTQSMMSVTFDAPPGGGEVTVKYPISFSPEENDAGGS